MEKEEYRDVVGFWEYFQISNLGSVFSKRSNRILKLTKSEAGYWTFATSINGSKHTFKVHRLVADAFIPNPESKPYVNHKDGCKTNNMLSNLEWVTAKENSAHAWATGLQLPRPCPNRKLTADQVREIRASTKSNRELASIYGIDHGNIGRIKRRETYKDVPDTAPLATGLRNRKLTADQVREIRASNLSQRKLGEIYGIDKANVCRIKRRESYKDVPDSPPSLSGVMQSFPDAQIGV